MNADAVGILGWLLTYGVHSTLFIAAAVLICRFARDEALRDVVWKTALLGAVLTASFAAGGAFSPVGGLWYAGDVIPFETRTSSPAVASPAPVSGGGSAPAATVESGRDRPLHADTARSTPVGNVLGLGLIAAWVLMSVILLLRLAVVNIRFFRAIDDRAPMTDGPLVEMLTGLRRASGYWRPVRLSLCAACPTPVAIGTREICLPSRYATDLDAEQQRGGLAHELAHLKRRDPLWQLAAGIVESVFFFQPLNWLVRSRLRETAEHLSDDWAASATGSSTGIARCLSEIASWVGSARVPRQAVAMVEGGSPLLVRIRRLARPQASRRASSWQRGLAALAPVGLVMMLAPTIAGEGTPVRPDIFVDSCLMTAVDTTIVSSVGLEALRMQIPAGSIQVVGRPDVAEARIIARRCASRTELFEALHLEVARTPPDLTIGFEQPTHLFSRTRGSVARIDLVVEIPESIAVSVEGEMGPVEVSDVGSLRLDTSLGDIQVVNVHGDVTLTTGVGEVVVGKVGGSVAIAADVGVIHVWEIAGDLTVKEGHTGSVEIARIEGGVVIEDGQAGDVAVSNVVGSLQVGHMAEGRLGVKDVAGPIVTANPGDGRGRDDD
jgi:beta-lactamase regulating signal transducer with metallopeptidase domain